MNTRIRTQGLLLPEENQITPEDAAAGLLSRVPVIGPMLGEMASPLQLNEGSTLEGLIMGPERTENFQRWFGSSKAVSSDGVPLTLFHGTTHDFDEFNPDIGEKESYFGSAIYLSDNPDDASVNYGAKGPDLIGRIERRAEQLEYELDDSGKELGEEVAMARAKSELMGPAERVIPMNASIKNPIYLSKDPETPKQYINFREMFEVDEMPQEEDFDNEDEFYEAEEQWYQESADQMYEGVNDKMRAAFYRSDDEANYKWADFSEKVMQPLFEEMSMNDGVITPEQINFIVRQNSYDVDHMTPGETLKEFFKELGYDGVIMDAGTYFPNMDYIEDTKHYILFDPTDVKGLFNRGTYDPDNPDFLSSRPSLNSGLLG
mgnify:CR=1 FL=1